MKQRFMALLAIAIFCCTISVQAADVKIGVLAKNGPAKAMKKWAATG